MRGNPESVRPHEEALTSRTLWFVVLGGPAAWLLDESIALVIEAGVCGGSFRGAPGYARPLLALVALAAIAAATAAILAARRPLRATDHDGAASRREERVRFMAVTGLLVATLSIFGIVLRLIASLVSPVCA